MPTLIDTSLWVDFTRPRSSGKLKRFIAPYILDPDAHLAEPIIFEVQRHASPAEAKAITQQFQTMPLLVSPATLWLDAVALGQICRQKRVTVNSLALIIAAIALHHSAEVITFDNDFQKIAGVSKLHVKLLSRPVP